MTIARVTTIGTLFGQDIKNVMHFQNNPNIVFDKNNLANFVRDRIIEQWKFGVCSAMVWSRIDVINAEVAHDPVLLKAFTITGALSTSTQVFPPMCAVLQLKTALSGRKHRGRIYLSGMFSSQLIQGRWDTNPALLYKSIADSMMQWFGGTSSLSGWRIGVCPRVNPTGNFKDVTQIVLRSYPGVQVRRNFLRGK